MAIAWQYNTCICKYTSADLSVQGTTMYIMSYKLIL